MKPDHNELLERTHRIVKENNRMLHAMRRNAFIGGVIKVIVWVALLGVPIWFYIQFVHPVFSSAVDTINQVQDTGAQVGAQFGELGDLLDKLKNIPGF